MTVKSISDEDYGFGYILLHQYVREVFFMSRHAINVGKLNGLKKALVKLGYDKDRVNGTCSFNSIMVKFLKSRGLPYQQWSKRYKGSFTADLVNAEYISGNCYSEFIAWATLQIA